MAGGKPTVLDDLEPRISMSIGVTLPTGQQYKMIRADVGATINKPVGMSAVRTYEWLEEQLLEQLDKVLRDVEEALT